MNDREEIRISWMVLILFPVSMAAMFAYVTAGLAPGIDAGHAVEYLQMTCISWALIGSVLPVLRITRIVAFPSWFTVLIYCDIYLYVISLCQGMYLSITWWGDLTHVIAAMVVGSIVFMSLCLIQAHSPSHVTLGSRCGMIAMLVLVAASFGGIWEILEGSTDIIAGKEYMSYGATDTLGDICADLIGVIAMSCAAWIVLGRQSAADVASRIRFGRKAFDP